jgi:O-antigen/teichoic acid export membrane protein
VGSGTTIGLWARATGSPLRRRVLNALGAGAFGQGVVVLIQLASVPAFLSVWGPAEYGVWLVLSAIPAYLAMADVGLVTAVGNEMTMATGRGDTAEANRLFQSALAFMLVTCGGLAALSLLGAAFAPFDGLSSADRRLALAALALTTVLALFSGLADAIFRATSRFAEGLMVANLVRLAEWAGWMAGLFLVGSFAAVAVGGLVMRAAGLGLACVMAARGDHGLRWGLGDASLSKVRRMARPAVSFMAFPLANALNFQGMTLLVGQFLGPAMLAVFATYRTLTRVAMQLSAMFAHSVWPELSRLYGFGGGAAVRSLYRRSAGLGVVISLGVSAALFVAAPPLLALWTHGVIGYQPGLMALMLAYAAVAGMWNLPRVMMLATNRHTGLALGVLLASALSLAVAAAFATRWGLEGVGIALLTTEVAIAVFSARLASRLLQAPPVGRSDSVSAA